MTPLAVYTAAVKLLCTCCCTTNLQLIEANGIWA